MFRLGVSFSPRTELIRHTAHARSRAPQRGGGLAAGARSRCTRRLTITPALALPAAHPRTGSQGLDEVESELEISKKLITRMVKRIYTDKVRPAPPSGTGGGAVVGWGRAPPLCVPPMLTLARPHPSLNVPQIIIAFTFLIVVGLVGIIVYATLNPNQKIFNVPDAIKPTIPGVTVSQTQTPSPTPTASVGSGRRLLRAGGGGAPASGAGGGAPTGASTAAAGGEATRHAGAGGAVDPRSWFHAVSTLARGGSGLRGGRLGRKALGGTKG